MGGYSTWGQAATLHDRSSTRPVLGRLQAPNASPVQEWHRFFVGDLYPQILQERLIAERRIQHLESSSSSTRQELNAARLAGIADRQKDDQQISSLKAQVQCSSFALLYIHLSPAMHGVLSHFRIYWQLHFPIVALPVVMNRPSCVRIAGAVKLSMNFCCTANVATTIGRSALRG